MGPPPFLTSVAMKCRGKGWKRGGKVPQRKHPRTAHLLLFKSIDLFAFFRSSFESDSEAGLRELKSPFLNFSISKEFVSEAYVELFEINLEHRPYDRHDRAEKISGSIWHHFSHAFY